MVRLRWEKFLLWVGFSAIAAVGVGQLAALVGSYLRPIGLFPLLVGGVLGGMLVFFMRLLDLAHRGTLLLGVVLGTLLCNGSEHWGCYFQAQRAYERLVAEWMAQTQGLAALSGQFAEAIQQQLPRAPGTFLEYMNRQVEQGRSIGPWKVRRGWVVASWGLEALLTFLAALALVTATVQWPYCPKCESWYRTVRQGRLLPEELGCWAEALALPVPSPCPSGRFRLLECLGQCGPTRLELFWENHLGQLQSWRAWLDPEQQQILAPLLDTEPQKQTSSDPGEPSTLDTAQRPSPSPGGESPDQRTSSQDHSPEARSSSEEGKPFPPHAGEAPSLAGPATRMSLRMLRSHKYG